MYENDPWVREFIINCFKIYGAPPAVVACVNHNEEVYHTFCAISLLLAMREQKDDWSQLRSEEPNDAAYAFAKIYFEKRGEHLIPTISYSDDYTEDGEYNDA
jgi:hypothetical protein|tara:strand:+ start:4206 stop:4511 length:306 start_codon:yes stop_codon:yes gene_type:complete